LSNLLKAISTRPIDAGVAHIPVRVVDVPVRALPAEESNEDTVTQAMLSDLYASAKVQCDEERERTQRECEELIEAARLEALGVIDVARRIGHVEGYQTGYEAGLHEAQGQIEERVQEIEGILQKTETERIRLFGNVAQVLTDIVTTSVKQVLQREMQIAPADIVSTVEQLLQYVIESTRVEIRVNPSDFETATAAHPRWRGMRFGAWDMVIVPDTDISVGGCVIRSDVGRVDARVETKLELLEQSLRAEIERSVRNDVLANT